MISIIRRTIKYFQEFLFQKNNDFNENKYTRMQKRQYFDGTSNHKEHNDNPDYWNILLSDLKDKKKWEGKNALDFACGKGRNVSNIINLCDWNRVDGIDISKKNIEFCREKYVNQNSDWYCNNGVNVSDLNENEYDFIMSTIALQHIPVYDIRKSLIIDLYRTLRPGGLFSFQMGYGKGLDSPIGKRSAYFDNYYNAQGTNSIHDVRVHDEVDVIQDLTNMGFVDVKTEVRDSFSDAGHTHWIYVKAYKKSFG